VSATKRANPLTGKPVAKKARKVLDEAYEARLGARKMSRSGHPGKRAEGEQGVRDVTDFIHGVYARDAQGLLQ
jgi:hypothetical protein